MSLRVDLRASRFLAFLVLGQYLLAGIAVLLLLVHSLFALLLLLPIGAGAHFLRHRPVGPRALVLMAGEWKLVYEERIASAELKDEVHCSSWLQILEFQVQEGDSLDPGTVFVTIFPDSSSAAERRQLRAILRWYHFPHMAAANHQLL